MSDAYGEGANRYRPQTQCELRRAVVDLLGAGFSDYGVSAALQLAVEEVRRLAILADSECEDCE